MSNKIARELLKNEAVFLRPNSPFTWASGIKSPIYCDNRITLSIPKTRTIIEESFANIILEEYPECEVVVGTATAGIGHAAIIAHILNKPMAYVRTSSKSHGRQNNIEGKIAPGSKVVVIEDLISTGGSSLDCVEILRENDIEVLAVLAIFTYGMQKSKDRFSEARVNLHTLTNLDILLQEAYKGNYIESEDIQRIKAFRDNPSDESWIK